MSDTEEKNSIEPGSMDAFERVDALPLDKGQHHDQYVQYSHQMTEDTAEGASRFLIRAVPLVYGALLGGLTGNMVFGLSVGVVLCMALDLRMGDDSLFRPLVTPIAERGCPVVTFLAHGMARVIRTMGLREPSLLKDMGCGGAP